MTLRTLGVPSSLATQTMNLRSVVTPSGTNDTAAVNTALAAFDAAGGGKIVIPRGNWKFTGSTGLALTGTSNPIHVEAEPGTVFDMTGLTAVTGITLGGSVTATAAALGADATSGTDTITCSLTPAAGDILRILSTDIFSPSTSQPKGELVEVLSVSGGVITLKSGLWDSYTAATTTVTLMQMPKVSVENLTILRNSNDAGLLIQYARNALLGGVHAEGARERLLYVDHALGLTVDNCSGRDFWYSGTGTSYGLVVGSSQGVEEIGNRFKGGRHAVSHGGTFPCRDVKVVGGTFDNYHPSGQHSFDFHSNCEDVRMIGSTVLNGLSSNALNFHGSNLTVRTVSTGVRGAQFGGEHSHDYIKLTDCDIQAGANGDAVLFAPRAGSTAFTVSRVEISGYIRSATGAGVRLAPATSADTGMTIDSMVLNGDIQGQTGFASQHTSAATVTLNTLRVRGRLAASSGSGAALVLTSAAVVGKVMVDDGAEVISPNAAINAPTTTADFYIGRAWIEGTDRNYFGTTGTVTLQNTILKGFTAVGGISAGSAASVFLNNLTTINVSGTPALPATTRGKVDVQRFTASGTWTKPAYAREVEVLIVGSGGGGGAGARGPSGTALSGGGGGGGGAISLGKFPASSLSATVAVTIPTAGAGAAAQTTDGTAGAAGGSPSGGSTFGAYLTASRGVGGGGGGLAVAGTSGGGGVGTANGSGGGVGSATGAAGTLGGTASAAAGGGGGGGITTAPLHTAGGNGGISAVYSTTAAVAGTAGGGTGPVGAATTTDSPGPGGAGGGGNTGGAGGAGGNGGNYGAGGGGGGASLNSSASGKGGDGAGGLCVVITYY